VAGNRHLASTTTKKSRTAIRCLPHTGRRSSHLVREQGRVPEHRDHSHAGTVSQAGDVMCLPKGAEPSGKPGEYEYRPWRGGTR
jgi:hypothetical protein